jgi:hypothetical protein
MKRERAISQETAVNEVESVNLNSLWKEDTKTWDNGTQTEYEGPEESLVRLSIHLSKRLKSQGKEIENLGDETKILIENLVDEIKSLSEKLEGQERQNQVLEKYSRDDYKQIEEVKKQMEVSDYSVESLGFWIFSFYIWLTSLTILTLYIFFFTSFKPKRNKQGQLEPWGKKK